MRNVVGVPVSLVAVAFRSLSARASKSGVQIRWSTASEIDMAGFNVYRQVHGKRVRVNHRIIASASRSGHRYSFVDSSLKGGPARVLSGRVASGVCPVRLAGASRGRSGASLR